MGWHDSDLVRCVEEMRLFRRRRPSIGREAAGSLPAVGAPIITLHACLSAERRRARMIQDITPKALLPAHCTPV